MSNIRSTTKSITLVHEHLNSLDLHWKRLTGAANFHFAPYISWFSTHCTIVKNPKNSCVHWYDRTTYVNVLEGFIRILHIA